MKLAAANQSAELVINIEDKHYSTNHAVVGNMLARNWCLPEHISLAILVHHDHTIFTHPGNRISPMICTLVAISQVAEHISTIFLERPDDAEWVVCGQLAQDHLGISAEDMADISEDALAELEEIRAYR